MGNEISSAGANRMAIAAMSNVTSVSGLLTEFLPPDTEHFPK
eukprot:CAMPEP_0119543898 /NCGR_PEP_ID=MMETSP1344-20130328/54414_1 /TAXON_ID=236787 /ORGANISM="Florenciella parvula, Strain CCMP2471" /LENGTH=41 /DNA_ID= /DNA_START= /DNA_END= /DNA_ORIENTATION=